MALSQEELDRLPPEVRAATMEKMRLEAQAAKDYEERLKKNCIIGAIMGGVGSAIIERLCDPDWPMYLLMVLFGAAGGFWTVVQRYKLFGGMAAFGALGILANVVGTAFGWIILSGQMGPTMVMLCSWLIFFGLGAMIGGWADGQRFRRDVGF